MSVALDQIREQIDALDHQIHLLMQRATLIRDVAVVKKEDGQARRASGTRR